MIQLSNAHIIIDGATASSLFAEAVQVNWVYYPARQTLIVAASGDELFKSLHKTSMSMLKFKNDKGDRSISIMELLIDNDIDNCNRPLDYFADEQMKVLNVYFGTGIKYVED